MTDTDPKKRGRPVGSTKPDTANKQMPRVRVTESQLETYKQAAMGTGSNFSQWVRTALDKAARSNSQG